MSHDCEVCRTLNESRTLAVRVMCQQCAHLKAAFAHIVAALFAALFVQGQP